MLGRNDDGRQTSFLSNVLEYVQNLLYDYTHTQDHVFTKPLFIASRSFDKFVAIGTQWRLCEEGYDYLVVTKSRLASSMKTGNGTGEHLVVENISTSIDSDAKKKKGRQEESISFPFDVNPTMIYCYSKLSVTRLSSLVVVEPFRWNSIMERIAFQFWKL
jgi:hypothetical protein